MATGHLQIDLDAIIANWRSLDRMSDTSTQTAAVVKADGYGLGAAKVAQALARIGARQFFVATVEEGVALRTALGPGPTIAVFSGHMLDDTQAIASSKLMPMLNSLEQMIRHFEALPGAPFGVQLDSGMNRLGLEPAEWAAARDLVLRQGPSLIISHLACADTPDDPMNWKQLSLFREMTDGLNVARSLAATGGILLNSDFHFDVTRPGVGLYGGLPFEDARPAVWLDAPVIQTRVLEAGETVGYGNAWTAETETKIATCAVGYADGLIRAMGDKAMVWADDVACPVVGRVSMDLLTVDVTHLSDTPNSLSLLSHHQTVDDLAEAAGTIGYEILTSLGQRYRRSYMGGFG